MAFFVALSVVISAHSEDLTGKVVFITGGAEGIGFETAKSFADKGATVYASTRKPLEKFQSNKEKIHFLNMDLLDNNSIKNAFETVIAEESRIDILINNAGYGIIGAEESISRIELQEIFQVNFFGAITLINLTLPYMREQKSGHIINISSTSGIRALPGLGVYAATKFALEGYSEALALSLSPFNIKVSIVEPGTVKNSWGEHCKKSSSLNEVFEYKKLKINLSSKITNLAKTQGQDENEIAKLIINIASSSEPNLRYQTSNVVRNKLLPFHNDLSGEHLRKTFTPFVQSLIQ